MSECDKWNKATEGDVEIVRFQKHLKENKSESAPEFTSTLIQGGNNHNDQLQERQHSRIIADMTDVKKKLSKFLNTAELLADKRCCIQGYYVEPRQLDDSPKALVVNVNSGCKEISQPLLISFLAYLKQLNPQLYEGITINNFKIVEQKSAPRLSAWKSNATIQFEQVGSIAFIAKYNDVTEGSNNGVGAVVACHTVTDEAIVRRPCNNVTGKLLDQVNNVQVHFTAPFEGINGFRSSRQEVGERLNEELPAVDLGMLYLSNHTGESPIIRKMFRGSSEDLPNELPVFKKDDAAVTGSVFIKSFSGPLFPGKPAYGDIMVVRTVGRASKFSEDGESGRAVLFKSEHDEEYLLGYIVAVQENFSYENSEIDHVTYVLYLHHGLEAFKEYCHKEIIVE